MSYLLTPLKSKSEIDAVIRNSPNQVVVLRFGYETDKVCLQQDDILSKCERELSKMAKIFIINVDDVPVYVNYFDITIVPSTLFFFNQQHIKIDFGTQDNTKFIGAFHNKQDCIDLVEVVYRGASRGKFIVVSPIDRERVPKYDLLYRDI
eukprot:c16165_g1_i1.p1 GENE.c16165_g1_i1~~c16165_g1_i1.p1  ORF type:complete len:150 (-),score=60.12 c16165_g1_i1:127-576(-)